MSKTRLKITFLESHSDLPGANELKPFPEEGKEHHLSYIVNAVAADDLATCIDRASADTVLT